MNTAQMVTSHRTWAKARLAALAIFGILAYQVILISPFALVIALNLLNPFGLLFGGWSSLFLLAFIWWLIQPKFDMPGVAVQRAEAPKLYQELDNLAKRLDTPAIDVVHLTDEFNAAAVESTVRWLPWRKRRILVLGVPLLAMVGADVARSVIAHELGHFSHRHGRLGHWIYRTRVGWLAYASSEASSPLDRGSIAFAQWFAPRFSRLSFEYSRRCEFEADAYGASVVGKLEMATALLVIEVFADRWRTMMAHHATDLIALQDTPPPSWLGEVERHLLARVPQPEEWDRLKNRKTDENDTHPSTVERLHAIGILGDQALSFASMPRPCAGAAWLPSWSVVTAKYDERWRHLHAGTWRREHIMQRHQRQRMERLRTDNDRSLDRAALELDYGETSTVIEIAQACLSQPDSTAQAAYLLGLARLRSGDASGVANLQDCLHHDAAWAAAARWQIDQHAHLLKDKAARQHNRSLLHRALDRRSALLADVYQSAAQGKLKPIALDRVVRDVLKEVLCGMPVVAAAWCLGESEIVRGPRRYSAIVVMLRLRTAVLSELGLTEDEVCVDVMALLEGLVAPAILKLVWTAYTTEALAPALHDQLAALSTPECESCLVIPKDGESAGPAVRAEALG
ncbi:MAG: Protease HtpX [Pseudomonadota bacterium]|jgi:Zn-dependent protease with chaperone function